ncbi:MAG: formylglycine-generating enzyme family protein, partial [Verrucomicrobiales bacterium]
MAGAGLLFLALPATGLSAADADADDKSAPEAPKQALHSNHLGMEFVPVPGIHVFFCKNETRVRDYQAFLAATGHEAPEPPHFAQGPDHPVVGIGQFDAEAFCLWLTEYERGKGLISARQRYRLPDKRHWDVAVGLLDPFGARSSLEQEILNKTYYPWGTQWPPIPGAGNFASDQIAGYKDEYLFTSPVGSFDPNEAGIYDLAGNVWEWCQSDSLTGAPQWVLRGGAWVYFQSESLLAGYEYPVPPDLKASSFGFRVVFEDPDLAPELTRSMMAKRSEQRKQGQSRFLGGDGEAPGADTGERMDARSRLLQGEFRTSGGTVADAGAPGGVELERQRLLE